MTTLAFTIVQFITVNMVVSIRSEVAENTWTLNTPGFTFSMRNQLFNSIDTSVMKVQRTVHGLSGRKPTLEKLPHCPVNEGIGKDFVSWLSSACGGGVAEKQAKQQSVRIMKFLKYCSEDDEDEVSRDFVDYCIGSPCLVSKFIEHSREEWSLTSSAQINYLQAIADMIDFRKFEGAAQSSARSFSLTEVCIHHGKRTLSK